MQTDQLQTTSVETLVLVGALAGVLLGIPLIAFLVTGRRRWGAVFCLNLSYLLAFLVAGVWAALFAVLATLLTLVLSALLLRHAFGTSTWQTFANEIRFALGQDSGFEIIEDGRVALPQQAGPVLGPRLVIIRPNNAVIFHQGSQQTRILGPCVFRSTAFEYAKTVVDLRCKEQWLTFTGVMSSDLLPTDVVVYSNYGINVSEQAKLANEWFTENERLAIQRVHTQQPNWDQMTRSVVESCVRQAVGSRPLGELISAESYGWLEERILDDAEEKMPNGLVRIDSVVVQSVRPTAEVSAAMAQRTQAAFLQDTLYATAEAYRVATEANMTRQEIYREVLRHTLEKITKDPAAKFYFIPELRSLLRELDIGI